MQTLIQRHKTAMHRSQASKPVRLALTHDLIASDTTVLDYGCGRGADVKALQAIGVRCSGWDPIHRPDGNLEPSDVVNLGYVVNVIEDPNERMRTLRAAWDLAERVLVVSARLQHENRGANSGRAFQDGCVTSRGTFQKFFDQYELRQWIEGCLDVPAVPAAPGIYYVFRSVEQREEHVARLFRRRVAVPRLRRSEAFFVEHEAAFTPLLAFMQDRGRAPYDGEVAELEALLQAAGSLRRAVAVLTRVFGADHWAAAGAARRMDLLVYLALAKFGGRPRAGDLAPALRNDARFFFGSYKSACIHADDLLFRTGNRELLEEAMSSSSVGKLTPAALYVHRDYLDSLPAVLRTYEGCARTLAGDVAEANVVKLARDKYQVSYLAYPTFDADPHPPLHHSVIVKLRDLEVRYRFYDASEANPPIIHRKDQFISPEDPRFAKFRRLTLQEERWGLLDDAASIGTRDGWNARLLDNGVKLAGHRIVKAPSV